jgi:NADPH:quinone reductase-like Zn-dependent oxidoreductase
LNAQVKAGHNVLITGISGGVALLALQICVARGATVYVTSGSQEKIRKAVALGARGGANYKESECFVFCFASRNPLPIPTIDDWPTQIAVLLKKDTKGSGLLDAVIDSGGGDIMGQTGKFLKHGGRVVCYGM